jgi:hypothetical protein
MEFSEIKPFGHNLKITIDFSLTLHLMVITCMN